MPIANAKPPISPPKARPGESGPVVNGQMTMMSGLLTESSAA